MDATGQTDTTPPLLRLRIVGETTAIGELAEALKGSGYAYSEDAVLDAKQLKFDLATVSAITAMIPVVLTTSPLLDLLVRFLRGKKRTQRIVIESQLGRVEFQPNRELTDAEVREATVRLGAII